MEDEGEAIKLILILTTEKVDILILEKKDPRFRRILVTMRGIVRAADEKSRKTVRS